jgi:hypothetical protein
MQCFLGMHMRIEFVIRLELGTKIQLSIGSHNVDTCATRYNVINVTTQKQFSLFFKCNPVCHHQCHINTSSKWIKRTQVTSRPYCKNTFIGFPHSRFINLTHRNCWKPILFKKPTPCHDKTPDLIARSYILIALVQNFHAGII